MRSSRRPPGSHGTCRGVPDVRATPDCWRGPGSASAAATRRGSCSGSTRRCGRALAFASASQSPRCQSTDMHHVFVSYSRRDAEWVNHLVRWLEQAGVGVWLDQRDIPVTLPWLEEVSDAILEADLFVMAT